MLASMTYLHVTNGFPMNEQTETDTLSANRLVPPV